MRGFMPIEAVAEAEAENEGRKREQSSSKKDTDSFHHKGKARVRLTDPIPSHRRFKNSYWSGYLVAYIL